MSVPQGLVYRPRFITEDEELELIRNIDSMPWSTALKRRVQHYGYVYDYLARGVTEKATPIPEWLNCVINRMLEKGVMPKYPDQVIVNEYRSGQGIGPHVDSVTAFDDKISSLSLGLATPMDFVRKGTSDRRSYLLEPRSLITLSGESRYLWSHGINPMTYEGGPANGRRISITFRSILKDLY